MWLTTPDFGASSVEASWSVVVVSSAGYTSSSTPLVLPPTSSMSEATRSDLPMWSTYRTSTMMLASTSTNATTMASPGTESS